MLNETFHEGFKYYSVGDRISGIVVSVGDDALLVDIGQRSEASMGIGEFQPEELAGMKIGDTIEACVIKFSGGSAVLSRAVSSRGADLSSIIMAKQANLPIEGKITGNNKGGFTVSVGNVRGFVPFSQMELGQAAPADEYTGKVFNFKVLETRGHEVVLSRAALLREEQAEERERMLKSLKPGMFITGPVVKVEKFGVFVDIGGGINALVPISELGWHNKEEILAGMTAGTELTVCIAAVGEKDGRPRISATLRNPDMDPWLTAAESIKEGTTVTGKVTRLMAFGAFVEILPGIEGLVHVSEIAAARRIRHPGDVLSSGDMVEASVLKIDHSARRISLSIKALQPAPERAESPAKPGDDVDAEVLKKYTPPAVRKQVEPTGETAFSLAMKKAMKNPS
jgi:small subunit ribosomal protein S1